MSSTPVPVFMYHTVGIRHKDWLWKFLTLEYQIFDRQMAVLKQMGCNSVTLGELYDHMNTGTPLPKNPFVLTFDDGYADNWISVGPILKKYGFRGTVYMNPEFVDQSEQCRPTLEDVWSKRASIDELSWKGFLSWPEMRALEKEGFLEIQSHGMSHTWYFTGPNIVDFQHPNDEYIWMNWNNYPDRKYSYMSDNPEQFKRYGAPIYENGKSLAIRRYFPDEDIKTELIDYVSQNGGKKFFQKPDWRILLNSRYEALNNNSSQGRFETDEEYEQRLDYELRKSKEILETQLSKKVEYLCWPGGGYNETSMKMALSIYKSVTLGSHDKSGKKNIPGDDPTTIKRLGIPYVTLNQNLEGIKYLGGFSLYSSIRTFQGSRSGNFFRKLLKAWNIAQLRLLGT